MSIMMGHSYLPSLQPSPPPHPLKHGIGHAHSQERIQINLAKVGGHPRPQALDALDPIALDQQISDIPVIHFVLGGVSELLHEAGADVVQGAGQERAGSGREQQRQVRHEPELPELRVQVLVGPVVGQGQAGIHGHAAQDVGPHPLPQLA
jgi:hypothetical protein